MGFEAPSLRDIEDKYQSNPSGLSLWIKHEFSELYEKLDGEYDGETFSEKIYLYCYGDDDRICNLNSCGKVCSFDSFGDGYRKFCSTDCRNERLSYSDIREKVRETHEEKYGGIGFGSNELKEKTYNSVEEKYGKRYYSKTQHRNEKYIQNVVNQIFGGGRLPENIIPLFEKDEYDGTGYYKKYPLKCEDCGQKFEDHFCNGKRPFCPNCNSSDPRRSRKENEFYDFLSSLYTNKVIRNDTSVLDGKELDFYLPEVSLAIEFNGLYWHSNMILDSEEYHVNKTESCESKNIKLIQIFENEWESDREVIRSNLKNILFEDQKIDDINGLKETDQNIFLDRRWYSTLDFVCKDLTIDLVGKRGPLDWYFKDNKNVYSKRYFLENVFYNKVSNLDSEFYWKSVKRLGWNRFWDCGYLECEFSVE